MLIHHLSFGDQGGITGRIEAVADGIASAHHRSYPLGVARCGGSSYPEINCFLVRHLRRVSFGARLSTSARGFHDERHSAAMLGIGRPSQ